MVCINTSNFIAPLIKFPFKRYIGNKNDHSKVAESSADFFNAKYCK